MNEEKLQINITPIVDICTALLIVFIVSGPLIIQPAIKVTPPEAVTNEENQEGDKVIIYITKDEKFAVNETVVRFDRMKNLLKEAISKTKSKLLIIRADKDALHGNLIKVMALAKKCGANKITIATIQKKQ